MTNTPPSPARAVLGTGSNALRALDVLVGGLTDNGPPLGFGFLYVTDDLAPALQAIVGDLIAYTGISHWCGGPVLGVMAGDRRVVGESAIAALALPWPGGVHCPFPTGYSAEDAHFDQLSHWLAEHNTGGVWCNLSPLAEQDPDETLAALADITGGYVMGPVSSGRVPPVFATGNQVLPVGFAGVVLSHSIGVHTALITGAQALGPIRTAACDATGGIVALDGRRPGDCFLDDCRAQLGRALPLGLSDSVDVAIHEHGAGSDKARYTLVSLRGLSPDGAQLVLNTPVNDGARVQFMKRNPDSFGSDFEAQCTALHTRAAQAKGGMYCADIALTAQDFENDAHDWALARRCMGDLPLIGVYADGVIAGNRLHRGSALMTLFE